MFALLAMVILTAGVPLALLAAQRSARRSPLASWPNWPDLRDRYLGVDAVASAAVLGGIILATLGLTAALGWLGASYQAALPKGSYQRMPELSWFSFIGPSLIVGILAAVLATDLGLRLALGARYAEYECAFGGASPGRRGDAGMVLLTIVLATLGSGWVVLGIDRYARFEEEHAVFKWSLALRQRSYPYTSVVAVVQSSHVRSRSREIEHARYFIVFTDGERWCNEEYGQRMGRALHEDAALIDFVGRKAGRALTRVRHIDDWTGP